MSAQHEAADWIKSAEESRIAHPTDAQVCATIALVHAVLSVRDVLGEIGSALITAIDDHAGHTGRL